MSAILNLLQSGVVDHTRNDAGAFAGAFFANQGLDSGSGYVKPFSEMQLIEIGRVAGIEQMSDDAILAFIRGHKDHSKAQV